MTLRQKWLSWIKEMNGLANDFDLKWAATQRPTCGKSLVPNFQTNPLSVDTNLNPDPRTAEDLRRLEESLIQVCIAPIGTMHGPRNESVITVPCSECSYGWGGAGHEGPLYCKPGPSCADQGDKPRVCEMDPVHFMVVGDCDACIGEPQCINGRYTCIW
jgi:hypothetical protein